MFCVVESLRHLIKDCDYYEKRCREAALKSKRVIHVDARQARPAWTNTNRIYSGKQHVNSGRMYVNSGIQNKSGGSRVNTGKQNVNTARVNRPVFSNQTSQVNLKSPKKCFSKQSSPVNRPFSRNTKYRSNIYAVKGKNGLLAVKTSEVVFGGKNFTTLLITNSGPNPDSLCSWFIKDHPLKHMEHRGIFDSGCSGHMTGNRAHLEDYQKLSKVGSVTFGGSKGSISGKGGQPQQVRLQQTTHHVINPHISCTKITQPNHILHYIQHSSPPQPPSSLTQPVQPPPTITQSSLTTPQPSSVQPTAITPPTQPVQTTSPPPVSSIPDIQPTLPPSPQIPSPLYHDTEGPSFEPSYHMSPPPSLEPEFQASRSSEESEQLRNLMDIVPRLESRVKSLEKELSETKQTLGTAILQLTEKVKKLENKLRKKRKSKEAKDAEGQDQEVPFETDQGDTFVTPEKSKGSGEAQEEQISPSTLEAAQILTIVASEGFKGSQAPLGSKIYKRKPKSTKTPTKILHFEEPDSAQVNTAQVNTAELNPDSTPSAQVNTGEVNAAEVNTAPDEDKGIVEDLKVIYELVMEEYKDRLPEGFDRMLWGDLMIMFNQGSTLTNVELKLETEEESSMALELIKFVKQQLEEFEDSNDDDHGEEERGSREELTRVPWQMAAW
ncbi:hypothetical protein Tco_0849625 [Tanacetum coccineum]